MKDLELSNTGKMLEDINWEIGELRMLMNGREDQLVQATTMLKDKEKHVELNDTTQKFSQAEKDVEQIVELTKKLVDLPRVEYYNGPSSSYEKPNDSF